MDLNDILAAGRATDEALEAYAREVFDLSNVADLSACIGRSDQEGVATHAPRSAGDSRA